MQLAFCKYLQSALHSIGDVSPEQKFSKASFDMNPWHDVEPGERAPESVDCIIEVPRGSRNKYELDKKTGLLRLDRVLYSAVFYPANYGFIPQTYCDDRDPLDILVLGQEQVVPMCILTARPIGMMQMVDQNEEDDKIIAIHENDPAVAHFRDISQLPEHTLNELQRFFEDYKILEHKKVRIERFFGREEACETIAKSLKLYTDSYNRDGSKRPDAPVLRSEMLERQGGGRALSRSAQLSAARRAMAHRNDDLNLSQAKAELEGTNSSAPVETSGGNVYQPHQFEVAEFVPAERPAFDPIAFDLRTLDAHAPQEVSAQSDDAETPSGADVLHDETQEVQQRRASNKAETHD